MAALAPAPVFYEHDSNGDPLSLGLVYTYANNSSTPLATYTDAGGGTQNTNPVTLDSAGRADIWLKTDALYTFVVKTASGATVYTVNDIGASLSFINLSASSGSSLIGFLGAGTAAESRTLQAKGRDVVSVKDYGVVGDGVANDAPALQDLFDELTTGGMNGIGFGGTGSPPSIYFPRSVYLINVPITIPNGMNLIGDGRGQTFIKAGAGFTGIMLQDKGNASKITISHMTFDANDEAGVTDLVNLGNGTFQWGTGGLMQNVMLRGSTTATLAGSCGLRHSSNVISILDTHTQFTEDGIIEGASSNVCWYDDISMLAFTNYGLKTIGVSAIGRIELESPAASSVGIYVSQAVYIGAVFYSQASGVANGAAIEIDSSAGAFTMESFKSFPLGGSTLAQIIDDNRSGAYANYGDPTGTGQRSVVGITDQLYVGGSQWWVKGHRKTNFKIRIVNTAGTLQNNITSVGDNTAAGAWQATVTGAQAALGNTPTGADASTAMAFGGKISSASTNTYIFNTADHSVATDAILSCTIAACTTGDVLRANIAITQRDVNGVTRKRPEIFFTDATTGAAFALTTANIGAGEVIDVIVDGFFRA